MPRRRRQQRKPSRSNKPLGLTPHQLRRLLRKRKAGALIIALIIVFAIAAIDRAGVVRPVGDDWARYHGQTFEVARVVDGDTIDLRIRDGDRPTTRVRLWGVDTPELAKPGGRYEDEPWAEEARDFTTRLVSGRRVTLQLQQQRLRGRYGRLLAYVVLPEGTTLNAELIARGYSKHDDRWSHDRAEDFDQLQRSAKREGLGLWSK